MALSNADLLKELSAKPIMEVVDLVKMLEEEWGVSAAAPVAVAATGAAADTPHSSSSILTSSTTSMIGFALNSLSRSSFDSAISLFLYT